MLGKLINNDMKSMARGVSNIYIAAFIAVGVMGICLFFDVGVGKFVSSLVLLAISIAAIVVTIMATMGEFRKSMFGDRGYLTQTLPVKAPTLLFSKWLTCAFWITVSYAVVFLCLWLIYYYWNGESSTQALTYILQSLPDVGLPAQDILVKTVLLISLKILLLLWIFILEVFFVMTLANVRPFDAVGSAGPVIYFFVVFGLVTFCSSRLERVFKSALLIHADGAVTLTADEALIDSVRFAGGASVTLTQIYFQIVVAVLLFIITAELLEKKVNVK